ncbi:MAG: hypothetical protein A9183_00740 [Dehalococcoides mccartyi]|nr:MAG: hypothetical protein A9183_00740 [Dehalococcoides mccartyi]
MEPKSLERKYQKLARLGSELGVPVPECFLEMKVTMPAGKIVHHHKQRSHSWNRNAYNIMFAQLSSQPSMDNIFGAGHINFKDISGSAIHCANGMIGHNATGTVSGGLQNYNSAGFGYLGGAGVNNAGIVIGSGINAEDFEGYSLQTIITNGSGAGQMSFVASEAHSTTYNAGTRTLTNTLVRYFNNNSSGDVTVNEVGIYSWVVNGYIGGNQYRVMVTRDKLGSPVVIPASGQLKITYTVSLVYPA